MSSVHDSRVCCAGSCLEGLCQAAAPCPSVAAPFICDLLEVVPGLCTQTHALLDVQQHLPLKAVGACLLLPSQAAGPLVPLRDDMKRLCWDLYCTVLTDTCCCCTGSGKLPAGTETQLSYMLGGHAAVANPALCGTTLFCLMSIS